MQATVRGQHHQNLSWSSTCYALTSTFTDSGHAFRTFCCCFCCCWNRHPSWQKPVRLTTAWQLLVRPLHRYCAHKDVLTCMVHSLSSGTCKRTFIACSKHALSQTKLRSDLFATLLPVCVYYGRLLPTNRGQRDRFGTSTPPTGNSRVVVAVCA